ncbi:MAG: cytochrome P450, partial [Pseudomonadota bacterium]|nr:cytochrome P450 [Pseudomonadota bacterium]
RTATADTEIRGKQIRKGERVGLFYGSANRDEEIFDRPFSFDVTRRPNRHLAFGMGEHFCAGAHVARLEMEMAFKYLVPRIDEIEQEAKDRVREKLSEELETEIAPEQDLNEVIKDRIEQEAKDQLLRLLQGN